MKGVSKFTVADATSRAVAGTATAAATGISSASHLSSQDAASSAAAATGSCNAAVIAPVSHRFVFDNFGYNELSISDTGRHAVQTIQSEQHVKAVRTTTSSALIQHG